MNCQNTPHISPTWSSYGVRYVMSFVSILQKDDIVIGILDCTLWMDTSVYDPSALSQ